MFRKSFFSAICLGLLFSVFTPANAADTPQKRAITLDDLARLQSVSSPVISPDGEWVVYRVSQIDVKEDKSSSHLWMVKWDGSVNLQLTYGKEGASDPKFSPDGRYISFLSSRPGPTKGDQIWLLDRRGGEAQQLTSIENQIIKDYAWSPDSKTLLLTLRPKHEPEPDDKKPEDPKKPDEEKKPKAPKPIVVDRYHFKQDREGYLHNDDWDCALPLRHRHQKGREAHHRQERGRRERRPGRPTAAGSPSSAITMRIPIAPITTDIFVVEPKAGSASRKLTTWTGPDDGDIAWSPDSKSIAYEQGAPLALLEYTQSKPAVVTLEGKVSYPAATHRPQRSRATLLARRQAQLPGCRRPQSISGRSRTDG